MKLGNNVRTFREARRESLRDCAKAVGMYPSHLSRVETGKDGCSDQFKLKLAYHFGVSVTALFFQETVPHNGTAVAEVHS